jgi:arylsulfatase A-like enzyme
MKFSETSMQDRPNILLIITDQHRADHLGCYGNKIVQTPNIDNLSAQGIQFNKFYVSCPICMPNRATLMTGRMPSLHGVRQNGQPLSMQNTTFTELLAASGYRTALAGKSHLQNISARPLEMGLRELSPDKFHAPEWLSEARKNLWVDGDYNQELPKTWEDESFNLCLPFYGFEDVSLVIHHGDTAGGDYLRWFKERHPNPGSLRGRENALDPKIDVWAPQAWRTAVPEELYTTSYVGEKTIDYLEEFAKSQVPFFLQMSFPDPHHPFTAPGKYWDMYDQNSIPAPTAFHHPQNMLPPHVAFLHGRRDAGKAFKDGVMSFACSEKEARGAIAHNYGAITMIDDAIGKALKRLDELGLKENTIIIFTSDHGDYMGDHQLLLKGAIHYQGLVRIPFIWADPRAGQRRGFQTDALSGTLDIATTILDAAGIEPFWGMQGKSLINLANGHDRYKSILIEEDQRRSLMGFPPHYRVRSLLTDRYRLSLYSGVEWGELYDLENDPNEFENLWNDIKYAEIKTELMESLARKQMDLSDASPFCTGHGP